MATFTYFFSLMTFSFTAIVVSVTVALTFIVPTLATVQLPQVLVAIKRHLTFARTTKRSTGLFYPDFWIYSPLVTVTVAPETSAWVDYLEYFGFLDRPTIIVEAPFCDVARFGVRL